MQTCNVRTVTLTNSYKTPGLLFSLYSGLR